MPRLCVLILLLAGCGTPQGLPEGGTAPASAAPQLLPTDDVLAAAGTDRITPGDDATLAARAAALQARGARLAATPVAGPPVP